VPIPSSPKLQLLASGHPQPAHQCKWSISCRAKQANYWYYLNEAPPSMHSGVDALISRSAATCSIPGFLTKAGIVFIYLETSNDS
jgi:hypothetical protein